MKKLLFLTLFLLSPLMSFAQQQTDDSAVRLQKCVQTLAAGNYATGSGAEELCLQFPQNTLGCAMDMIDMKMESDFFEAIEYCADPIVRR